MMMTQIELRHVVFHAFHGCLDQERKVGNTFIVDLRITLPLEKAMKSDRIADTVDYSMMYEIIKREMAIPSRLIEHVAGRIIAAIHRQFPQIAAVHLRLSKQNPPIGADIDSAAVIVDKLFEV